MDFVGFLADDFFGFVESGHAEGDSELAVAGCLEEWVLEGDAVELAGGNFATYLQAVLCIVARIQYGRAMNKKLHARFIQPPFGNMDGLPTSLDATLWAAAVFRRKYGANTSIPAAGD